MFADTAAQEVGMYKLIENAQEARVAGYIENSLEMLLYSRLTPLGKGALSTQSIPGSPSIILPYICRRQKRNVNSNYFRISAGAATPGAGSGGLHPGLWDLTIRNTASTYGSTLRALEDYFLPGKRLLIECLDSSNNALSVQFEVVASDNADSGGVYQAKVSVKPNYTVAGYNALTAGEKTDLAPTAGNVIAMSNRRLTTAGATSTGPSIRTS
jgi:hypothetical protein